IDWRGIFSRLTTREPRGLGLTYAEAAQLTWPQLLHAMGVQSGVSDNELADCQAAKQDEIFARITATREYLPVDLWRLPVQELAGLVRAETKGGRPATAQLLDGLRRFVAEQMNSSTASSS